MTKKFVRNEWGRVNKKHIGNMYDTTCQICPDPDLLDLFQSFEDRIDKLQQENKSLRDDVNYLREKMLNVPTVTSCNMIRIDGPIPVKEEKPKRNFEILFADEICFLMKTLDGSGDAPVNLYWNNILMNPTPDSNLHGILISEVVKALKEFKGDN